MVSSRERELSLLTWTAEKKFVCDFMDCGIEFDSARELKMHKVSCHGLFYQCEQDKCFQVFESIEDLNDHMENAHVQEFVCPHPGCGKSFARNCYRKHHFEAVHALEKSFVCTHPGCSFATTRNSVLKRHFFNRHEKKDNETLGKKMKKKTGPKPGSKKPSQDLKSKLVGLSSDSSSEHDSDWLSMDLED